MNNYTPRAQRVFELAVACDPPSPIGRLRGGDALMIPITGGKVRGERLSGEVMAGGADWAIRYENDVFVVDARYAIKADDGTIIQVFNGATNRVDRDNLASLKMLTSPRFIAPEGPHEWLNHGVFVGTLEPDSSQPGAVHIVIFQLV